MRRRVRDCSVLDLSEANSTAVARGIFWRVHAARVATTSEVMESREVDRTATNAIVMSMRRKPK